MMQLYLATGYDAMEDTPGVEGEVDPLERDGSVWREEGGRDGQWSCR